MTQRRVLWDRLAYDIIENTGIPLSEKPALATYHSTLTKTNTERYTYWAADLDIGQVKELMVENQWVLRLVGNGAPYYLMIGEYED